MLETTSPQAAWEAALGELQIQVNKANYETWLKKTTGSAYSASRQEQIIPSR